MIRSPKSTNWGSTTWGQQLFSVCWAFAYKRVLFRNAESGCAGFWASLVGRQYSPLLTICRCGLDITLRCGHMYILKVRWFAIHKCGTIRLDMTWTIWAYLQIAFRVSFTNGSWGFMWVPRCRLDVLPCLSLSPFFLSPCLARLLPSFLRLLASPSLLALHMSRPAPCPSPSLIDFFPFPSLPARPPFLMAPDGRTNRSLEEGNSIICKVFSEYFLWHYPTTHESTVPSTSGVVPCWEQ